MDLKKKTFKKKIFLKYLRSYIQKIFLNTKTVKLK